MVIKNDAKECTKRDLRGPEYKFFPPKRKFSLIDNQNLKKEQPIIVMSGKVILRDGKPVKNSEINIWHPDNTGFYSFFGYDCRGIITTDDEGNYSFESLLPGMITLRSITKGILKYDGFKRPPHFHISIEYNNGKVFTTQIYTGEKAFRDDTAKKILYLKPEYGLLIEPEKNGPNEKYVDGYYTGKFDFILP